MALITCPECGRQISDRAPACPGCGILIEDIRMLLNQNSEQSDISARDNINIFSSEEILGVEALTSNTIGFLQNSMRLDNKRVKCFRCNNNYIASDLKCPKCKEPIFTLAANPMRLGQETKAVMEKTSTNKFREKIVKCLACGNEYVASDLNCPKCKFPILSLSEKDFEQWEILPSAARAKDFDNIDINSSSNNSLPSTLPESDTLLLGTHYNHNLIWDIVTVNDNSISLLSHEMIAKCTYGSALDWIQEANLKGVFDDNDKMIIRQVFNVPEEQNFYYELGLCSQNQFSSLPDELKVLQDRRSKGIAWWIDSDPSKSLTFKKPAIVNPYGKIVKDITQSSAEYALRPLLKIQLK